MCRVLTECGFILHLITQSSFAMAAFSLLGSDGLIFTIAVWFTSLVGLAISLAHVLFGCIPGLGVLTKFGVSVFLMLEFLLLVATVYGVFIFTRPFFTTDGFTDYCEDEGLVSDVQNFLHLGDISCSSLKVYYLFGILMMLVMVFSIITVLNTGATIRSMFDRKLDRKKNNTRVGQMHDHHPYHRMGGQV